MAILINVLWKSEALALDDVFLDFMADYLDIFLDFGMVFYSYAIILFKSRIVVLEANWEV
jgi:hypothetical protein